MRIVALTLLWPLLASAEDRTLLYINPAPLVTASRLTALGGAAVGLADNSESLPFNYAAVAQRSPKRKGNFDWDVNASVLLSPFPALRDTDNEGKPPDVIAPFESQFGGLFQFSRFGVGAYVRTSAKTYCPPSMPGMCVQASETQGAAIFGFNALRDQLVFGGGVYLAGADFYLNGVDYKYLGYNLGAGLLWRPIFYPFRLGIHGVSQTVGRPQGFTVAMVPPLPGGRSAFEGIVSPARLSVGGSVRFGEGAWRYNRLSPSALKALPDDYNFATVPHDLDSDDPRPPGRFLLMLSLDIVFPVKGATTLTPFLLGTPTTAAGESISLVPRLGFEAEAIDHRLRLRVGGYVEPPILEGQRFRPHVTWGTEVFLFNLLADWSVSASMDFADKYLSLAFGIGWWT